MCALCLRGACRDSNPFPALSSSIDLESIAAPLAVQTLLSLFKPYLPPKPNVMPSPNQGGMLSASHYRDEIAVIQALNELVHPSQQSSPQHVINMQQAQVCAAYLQEGGM